MNVTSWLASQAEIMSVCSDDKTEKGAHKDLMDLDVGSKFKSERMCLLLLGFGYWVLWDLAIAFLYTFLYTVSCENLRGWDFDKGLRLGYQTNFKHTIPL